MILARIISIIIGYLCGLFQTAYIYGRLHHIDIREHGSGNAGTTNALRTLGKKAGAITFMGDFLKPVLAMTVVYFLYRGGYKDSILVLSLYAGIGAVIGHVFPIYLSFRGGKGVATIAGIGVWFSIVVGGWYLIIIGVVTFVLVVGLTRYVSLGSLFVITGYVFELILINEVGFINIIRPYSYEVYGMFIGLIVLTFYKHSANIRRLLSGNENKLGVKKAAD